MGSADAMRGLGCSGPMPRPSSGTFKSFASRRVAGGCVASGGDAPGGGCVGGGGGGAYGGGGGYGGGAARAGVMLHPSSAGRARANSSFGRYTPVPEELEERMSPERSTEASLHSSPRKSSSSSPTKAALADFGAL